MSDLDKRVYQQFSTGALQPCDQRNLYVDLESVRGNQHPTQRLAQTIRFSESGKPTCQVLAGHMGSGKSTELLRLKKDLEDGDPSYFVVYVLADEYLDRNDIDFPDLLLTLIRQLAVDLQEREGISLKPGYFRDRLERLKGLLASEVSFDKFTFGGDLLKISGEIKGSPEARKEIRRALEADTSNLLVAANDLIGEALVQLSKKGKQGLVLIVDDLDKIIVRPREGLNATTDEYLFVNRAAQLTGFGCHVVYTVPLSLAYSHHENAIRRNYGGYVPVVPMTKVAGSPPDCEPHESGIDCFRNIIDRRLAVADAKFEEVFADDDVCRDLIRISGGQPTELMTLVREGIVTHGLPIDQESLKRAELEGNREYSRMLMARHWPILNEIRQSGQFARSAEREDAFRELLNSRAVLQYVNDREWYGLNPMVADLTPPNALIEKP
jgi:AAA ATPase-like protein